MNYSAAGNGTPKPSPKKWKRSKARDRYPQKEQSSLPIGGKLVLLIPPSTDTQAIPRATQVKHLENVAGEDFLHSRQTLLQQRWEPWLIQIVIRTSMIGSTYRLFFNKNNFLSLLDKNRLFTVLRKDKKTPPVETCSFPRCGGKKEDIGTTSSDYLTCERLTNCDDQGQQISTSH